MWPTAISGNKYVERTRIVLASADRGPAQQVAHSIGVSRLTVWRWLQRFADAGVAGSMQRIWRARHLKLLDAVEREVRAAHRQAGDDCADGRAPVGADDMTARDVQVEIARSAFCDRIQMIALAVGFIAYGSWFITTRISHVGIAKALHFVSRGTTRGIGKRRDSP